MSKVDNQYEEFDSTVLSIIDEGNFEVCTLGGLRRKVLADRRVGHRMRQVDDAFTRLREQGRIAICDGLGVVVDITDKVAEAMMRHPAGGRIVDKTPAWCRAAAERRLDAERRRAWPEHYPELVPAT